ncbi:hypothetical protein [Streptomyces decoyicus]|uniref:hypothetical protein n=1 Tax=Streptomyces decoyicus TaxID=249567 RepID=UPI0036559A4B
MIETLRLLWTRSDPRDYIDLAAQYGHWGHEAFSSLVAVVLRRQAQQSPGEDPAALAVQLSRCMARISDVPQHTFAVVGAGPTQAEGVRATVLALAKKLAGAEQGALEGADSVAPASLPEARRAALYRRLAGVDQSTRTPRHQPQERLAIPAGQGAWQLW